MKNILLTLSHMERQMMVTPRVVVIVDSDSLAGHSEDAVVDFAGAGNGIVDMFEMTAAVVVFDALYHYHHFQLDSN